MHRSFRFLVAAVAIALPCEAFAADTDVDFYKGKQVSLIIALPPGGGYDLNARVVARHIGRHVPGAPRPSSELRPFQPTSANCSGTPEPIICPACPTSEAQVKNSTIDVRPVSAHTGALIEGVDLREPLEDRTYREIRNALNTHGVIFFRNQNIAPGQHLAFAQRFGEIDVDPTGGLEHPEGYPMICEIRKEPDQTRNIGGNWHSDHAFDKFPPLGSILLARELPEYGGDTLFASMYAAYDALSDGLKKTLEGMRAVHAKTRAYDGLPRERQVSAEEKADVHAKFATREAVHPVVPRHPESGRRLLFVNPTYTVRFEGWTEKESEPLLKYLFQHAARPEFTYRFQWEVGSIAFWDNRSVWHYALNDYHGSRRLMHRIGLKGTGFEGSA